MNKNLIEVIPPEVCNATSYLEYNPVNKEYMEKLKEAPTQALAMAWRSLEDSMEYEAEDEVRFELVERELETREDRDMF